MVLGVRLELTVSVRCRITNPVQSPLCDPSTFLKSFVNSRVVIISQLLLSVNGPSRITQLGVLRSMQKYLWPLRTLGSQHHSIIRGVLPAGRLTSRVCVIPRSAVSHPTPYIVSGVNCLLQKHHVTLSLQLSQRLFVFVVNLLSQ